VNAVRKTSASSISVSPSRPKASTIRDNISIILLRGGQSQNPYQQSEYYSNGDSRHGNSDGDGKRTPSEGYRNLDSVANYNSLPQGEANFDQEKHPLKESVQERTDKWRSAQMERYANLSPEQEYNPRDEEGRMKLLSSVSKGSRALIFFVLIWRDTYLFEMTDLSIKGSLRKNIVRFILTTVFIGNLAGLVTSVISPTGHSSKKRLKAILNLDKVVETGLLLWNFARISLFPSKYILREVFIAGIFHSIFIIIQCQAFTRVTWDEKVAPSMQSQKQQQKNNQSYQQTSVDYQQQTSDDIEISNVDYGMNPGERSTSNNPYSN